MPTDPAARAVRVSPASGATFWLCVRVRASQPTLHEQEHPCDGSGRERSHRRRLERWRGCWGGTWPASARVWTAWWSGIPEIFPAYHGCVKPRVAPRNVPRVAPHNSPRLAEHAKPSPEKPRKRLPAGSAYIEVLEPALVDCPAEGEPERDDGGEQKRVHWQRQRRARREYDVEVRSGRLKVDDVED